MEQNWDESSIGIEQNRDGSRAETKAGMGAGRG